MTSYNVQLSLLRKKRNLSLKEAAKQIGISRFVLYLYENGYFRPSKAALKNIEEFYQEKISFEGESAYPAPLKEKAIKEKKESFLIKRIVFGTLSLFTLLSVITGIILFNKSVNNKTSYYGETYNEMKAKVEDHGEVGHDLVTALTYHYIDSYDAPNYATIIYYETNNILYFNEAIYSTTYLTSDYGVVRYHFKFGSNLSVNSNVCEFHFGSWSLGIYATCNFTYTGEKIDKVDNYNLQLAASEKIEEQEVVDIINDKIDEVEQAFSTILSAELEKDTSFYHDFLPAREKGRIVNFALQIAALFLILPGVVAFFIFFGLFVKAMIANIKPRLVTAETNKGLNKSETLPKDLKINFGIPDMFIIIISKFLQYGSIIIMLLSIIGKVGLPLPAFMSNANFIFFLRIAFLAGIFLEHFTMIGRIKKATTLFQTIVLNLGLFLFIATIETTVISITNAWGYDFATFIVKFIPSNVYQVVAVHYLIFLFLFFQPPFLNKRKKYVRVMWHSLSFIPLGFLIAIYFLSNSYMLTYGVENNIFIDFWFPNGFLALSVVCVLFMYITFAVRIHYERKFGQSKAQSFFYGDRYTLIENAICCILIIIVGAIDFIFANNQYAYYLGLGSNYWIFAMIPFIILCKYSPNNQQIFVFKEELEIPLRANKEA